MIREINLTEISDGKKYSIGDMAKLGVDDCRGCHACCCGMGDTITLDPYDVYRLEKGLSRSFEELLSKHLELRVADGIILPCLRMSKEQAAADKESCTFLNESGRCSIHPFRPSICRFENNTHMYFLQVNECRKDRQNKIKIKKWLDTPEIGKYENYIDRWHYKMKSISDKSDEMSQDELKAVNMKILQTFFITDYDTDADFYIQFEERLSDFEC